MAKVILVLSDALRDDRAAEHMSFLEHLVETRRATRYKVRGELPTMSRPCYEAVHTGVAAMEHGITSNHVVRLSRMPSIFSAAQAARRVTAASAYCWFSELYNRAPFDMVDDREVDDTALPIQHGRFYNTDDYPDFEVFTAGAALVRKFAPDYLLIHPMATDYLGERHGGDSYEYRHQITAQDSMLAYAWPEWEALGYTLLVTGDHGIGPDRLHGGTRPDMRDVPLYVIAPQAAGRGNTGATVSQLQIAPTVCALLGVPIPPTMQQAPIAMA